MFGGQVLWQNPPRALVLTDLSLANFLSVKNSAARQIPPCFANAYLNISFRYLEVSLQRVAVILRSAVVFR
jgi:hypothetical protein